MPACTFSETDNLSFHGCGAPWRPIPINGKSIDSDRLYFEVNKHNPMFSVHTRHVCYSTTNHSGGRDIVKGLMVQHWKEGYNFY